MGIKREGGVDDWVLGCIVRLEDGLGLLRGERTTERNMDARICRGRGIKAGLEHNVSNSAPITVERRRRLRKEKSDLVFDNQTGEREALAGKADFKLQKIVSRKQVNDRRDRIKEFDVGGDEDSEGGEAEDGDELFGREEGMSSWLDLSEHWDSLMAVHNLTTIIASAGAVDVTVGGSDDTRTPWLIGPASRS
ncbi:hypothetical protein PPACK8108_LOCUS25444 [Phakopsora pachyrhizi]|uniref:Uncharacterized protein n=1 Tax=Phakopsora pachyrhizi TaxID=170000 RepID=A0AAV0BSU7_PHAPC|nr:hypothetical protein PPACK8108_LOCUS25444 [Phakopsora pachyrhizi]